MCSSDLEADDDAAAEAALDAAVEAFASWRNRPVTEREELLASAADVLRNNEGRYAETMTEEMGKPIDEAVAEVEKCAWACDHYAEYAGAYLAAEAHPSPPGTEVRTLYDPLGPVLAVMPWNFPFWQVIRFAAP